MTREKKLEERGKVILHVFVWFADHKTVTIEEGRSLFQFFLD